MTYRMNDSEISLVADAMRAGIELWQKLVDEAAADGLTNSPIVTIMKQQMEAASVLKVKFEDAEQVVVS